MQKIFMTLRISIAALLLSTGLVFAAQSQETLDAIQDARIETMAQQIEANTGMVRSLTGELGGVRSTLDRLNGVVVGFGLAFTVLQVAMVLLQWRGNGIRKHE